MGVEQLRHLRRVLREEAGTRRLVCATSLLVDPDGVRNRGAYRARSRRVQRESDRIGPFSAWATFLFRGGFRITGDPLNDVPDAFSLIEANSRRSRCAYTALE